MDLQQIAPFPINLPPKVEQCRIADAIEEDIAQLDAAIRRMQVAKKKLTAFRASVLQSTGEGRLVPTEAELSQRHKDTNLADRPYETGTELLARILKERRERWEEEEVTKFAADLRCKLKNTQNDALSTDADKSRELAIAAKISEFRCDNKWKLKYREPTPPETSNLPALPRDWAWATLGQVAHVQGGIQKQPSRMPKAYRFPFLRVANVKRGTLDLKEVHEVELFGIGELDKLRLTKGDLLIVEGNGSPSEIGRMAIWTGEIRDCVHQNHIIRSRLSSGVLPEYVEAFWNSPAGSKAVQGQSSSTTGLHTLSVSKVGAIPIPLPPTTEQYRIVESVSRAMLEADQATNVITRLELRADALRQSILKIAFAGKLVPQYPSEEPALALLDRLESLALNLRSGSKRASKQSKSKKAAPVSNETIPTSL